MSASLLDLVGKKCSVDGLAGWLEGKGSAREADKVRGLADDVARVCNAAERGTTADILAVLRSHIGDGGLDASATALDQWSHGASAAHGDDLDALAELAYLESDSSRFPAWLSEQLSAPIDVGGVTLALIHAVKGREWSHVVVHHATAGLLPHRLAEDMEEERRVFHVALTRCRSSASIISGSPLSRSFSNSTHRVNRLRMPRSQVCRRPGPARPALGRHLDAVRRKLGPKSSWGQWDRASPTAATITR
jgi:DNA helicase-2/ATP-dependent DNA helicase PcrA